MDWETEAEQARPSRVIAVLLTIFQGYSWACPTPCPRAGPKVLNTGTRVQGCHRGFPK